MKHKLNITMLKCSFFGLATFTLICSCFAWFAHTTILIPTFDAGVVKNYFDAESDYIGTTENGTTTYTYVITKASHLYNLSKLVNNGVFKDSENIMYKFQIGKLASDGNYYVYSNENANELSYGDLNSDAINMSTYNKGEIPPIGSTTHPFKYSLQGNYITIKNLKVVAESSMSDIGMFGVVKEGASIKNFNLDSPTIVSNTIGAEYMGFVAGNVDVISASTNILSGIGIKDGKLQGSQNVKSKYSLIGRCSTAYASLIENNYVATSDGDVGVMSVDDMKSVLDEVYTDGTVSNSEPQWTKSFYKNGNNYDNYQYGVIFGSNENNFGIFDITTKSEGDSGIRTPITTPLSTMYHYDYDFTKNFTFPYVDGNSINTGTTSYWNQTNTNYSGTRSLLTLGDSSNDIAKRFIKSGSKNELISSVQSSIYFGGSVSFAPSTVINYSESTNYYSDKLYYNVIHFDIHDEEGGDVNFIAALDKSKNGTTDRRIGLWRLNNEPSSSVNTIWGKPPSLNTENAGGNGIKDRRALDFKVTNGAENDYACAFSFHLPQGSYVIGSYKNGLGFAYVSVTGQESGNAGEETGGSGIPVDFIANTSSRVSSNGYLFSSVAFEFTYVQTNLEGFIILYKRDEDSEESITTATYTIQSGGTLNLKIVSLDSSRGALSSA